MGEREDREEVWEFGRAECVAWLFWKMGYLLISRQHKKALAFCSNIFKEVEGRESSKLGFIKFVACQACGSK